MQTHLFPNSWGTDLREFNDCHNPGGSPEGGQFCSGDGGRSAAGDQPVLREELRQGQRGVLKVISVGGEDVGIVSRNGRSGKWTMYWGIGDKIGPPLRQGWRPARSRGGSDGSGRAMSTLA